MRGNALLRDNAIVNGNLTMSGVFQHQNLWTITGTLLEGAAVTLPTLATRAVPSNAIAITVNNGQSVTVNPGTCGNLTAFANGRVTFLPGTYNFATLNLQPDVAVILGGATAVNVAGAVTWSDRVRTQTTATRHLTLYTNANQVRIGTDAVFDGFMLAPNASLEVSSRTQFRGCLGARIVTFQPDISGGRGWLATPRPQVRSSQLAHQAAIGFAGEGPIKVGNPCPELPDWPLLRRPPPAGFGVTTEGFLSRRHGDPSVHII